MRFNSTPRPTPYLNGRDQRRLLGIVLSLSFVVMAVLWASRPESWHWLIPPGNETAQNVPLDEIDPNEAPPFRGPIVYGPGETQNDVETTSSAAPAFSESSQQNPFGSAPPFQDDYSPESATSSFSRPEEADNTARVDAQGRPITSPTQVPADWLTAIDDSALGLRAEEGEAYFRLLAHIQRLDAELVQKSARQDVLHVNLMRSPKSYRGQLIQFRGTAKRILPIELPENDLGLQQAYEVWFYSADSGNDPWRLVTTDLDPRLPVGEQVSVPIQGAGYFFKQYSYATQNGVHVAPMLLGAYLSPMIVQKPVPSGTGLEPYLVFLAVLTGGTAMIAVWIYNAGDRRFKSDYARRFPVEDEASQEVLAHLKDDTTEPFDFLEKESK